MSDTPKAADEVKKLLDNDWTVLLYKNQLGSYTAVALKPGDDLDDLPADSNQITDDFEPSQALYRLTEKCLTGRIV